MLQIVNCHLLLAALNHKKKFTNHVSLYSRFSSVTHILPKPFTSYFAQTEYRSKNVQFYFDYVYCEVESLSCPQRSSKNIYVIGDFFSKSYTLVKEVCTQEDCDISGTGSHSHLSFPISTEMVFGNEGICLFNTVDFEKSNPSNQLFSTLAQGASRWA